jgi:dTMP kinase
MAGKFLSIEGGEGVGKSTQINALADTIRRTGQDVLVTREPGGTDGAEAIRRLLLSGSAERWEPAAEAMLFAAARSDHVARLIHPALQQNKWVISDRYLDSSRAYQGASSGIGDEHIMALHAIGSGGFLPHRTLVLDLPPDVSAHRTELRDGTESDRIGGRASDFHQKVRAAFVAIAAAEPERVRLVDASGTKEAVTARLLAEIADLMPT